MMVDLLEFVLIDYEAYVDCFHAQETEGLIEYVFIKERSIINDREQLKQN